MKKLSEQLLEMSQRAAASEQQAADRNEENRKQFETDRAEAQAAVKSAQATLETRLDNVKQSTSSQWRQVQTSFNAHVVAARGKADEGKAGLDLAIAQQRAEDADTYAEIAVDFARVAAAEANAAILDATEAHAHVTSLQNAAPQNATA